MPTRVGSRQAAWDSQSEEGAAEAITDPAAAEPSLEGGGPGERRGGEGWRRTFHRDRVGSKKKGEGTNQEAR